MEKNFDELKEQAKQTSCMLAALTKAVQFNAEEVKECKECKGTGKATQTPQK